MGPSNEVGDGSAVNLDVWQKGREFVEKLEARHVWSIKVLEEEWFAMQGKNRYMVSAFDECYPLFLGPDVLEESSFIGS